MFKILRNNNHLSKSAIVCAAIVSLASCNSGSTSPTNSNNQIQYSNFKTFTNVPGSSTYITGVRGINDGSDDVYITGLYQESSSSLFSALIYTGLINGNGSWEELSYPGVNGETVTSTSFYGPDNNGFDNLTVVGCYTTEESGTQQLGLMYQGPVTGGGNWTTLNPPQDVIGIIAENTIAHSTMGGLIVGNSTDFTGVSKGFIYNIDDQSYQNINLPGHSAGVTAYGIWYNGSTNYTIAGGYSDLNESGFDVAYLIDYDSTTRLFSNFESYSYNNQPSVTVLSHFEGITTDGGTGYNLAADVESSYLTTAFVHVNRNSLGDFNPVATWTDISYPNAQITSANTVYQNSILGVYSVIQNDGVLIPFIATVPY